MASTDESAAAWALRYIERGWCPVPLPPRTKRPLIDCWQELKLTLADVPKYFSNGANLGINLGASHLADVDLDCAEVLALAPAFLPATGLVFGRRSSPRSHWIYAGPDFEHAAFLDPLLAKSKDDSAGKRATLVELRANSGHQTVFPPSRHPSGEFIEWGDEGEAASVAPGELGACVAQLAAAALLARYWPSGARHQAALALAGGLLRGGWSKERAGHFIETIARAAGDEEWADRAKAVEYTAKALAANKQATGWPTLGKILDERVVTKVRDWLGLTRIGAHTEPANDRPGSGTAEGTDPDSRSSRFNNNEKRQSGKNGRFTLTALADLLAEPDQEIHWLVDGMLVDGGISMLAAKPKVGKSTLARNLALAVARGTEFLGCATAFGHVVYLALEEHRSGVKEHFRKMGAIDEDISIHTGSAPEQALEALRVAIAEYHPRLAIVDPVMKLIRVQDVNAYAEVTRAFEPLLDLARQSGCHILLLHHLGKGERVGGDAILGSTALFGAVDAALLMKRHESQRTIETDQRYGENLPETVLAFDPVTGLITPAGEVSVIRLAQTKTAVLAAVASDKLTEVEIRDRVSGNNTLVAKAIRELFQEGKMARTGDGVRGDPFRYSKPP